MYRTNKITKFF